MCLGTRLSARVYRCRCWSNSPQLELFRAARCSWVGTFLMLAFSARPFDLESINILCCSCRDPPPKTRLDCRHFPREYGATVADGHQKRVEGVARSSKGDSPSYCWASVFQIRRSFSPQASDSVTTAHCLRPESFSCVRTAIVPPAALCSVPIISLSKGLVSRRRRMSCDNGGRH